MNALSGLLVGEDATLALGEAIGKLCRPGDVIALVGPLGAGKTTWTQGFVAGLELPEGRAVRSPTFTMCNEYPCRIPVLHYDLYRLGSADEADSVGFRERVGQEAVSVVEWADLFPELIPSHALWVLLEHESGSRRVTLWEGPGGDISWASQLPTSRVPGEYNWTPTDRRGPWERLS
jgi:tRNA threonylcarbamoyladenosine biosynthesis protein TsaE